MVGLTKWSERWWGITNHDKSIESIESIESKFGSSSNHSGLCTVDMEPVAFDSTLGVLGVLGDGTFIHSTGGAERGALWTPSFGAYRVLYVLLRCVPCLEMCSMRQLMVWIEVNK